MKISASTNPPQRKRAFSLVEVVVALGVIGFAVIAILGVFPIGLDVSHSSQDETRASQIAQDVLASLASQAPTKYPNLKIVQPTSNFSYDVSLSTATTYKTIAADNNGNLIALPTEADKSQYPYHVLVRVDPAPANFDPSTSSLLTVRVAWKPFDQNYRDFIRIISKQ